ncbi:hypothetical protein PGO_141910 [Plasmodium gonderi]|uniref:Uncharacterized protein n=1 Tax=Plasmodium gonderi TaxID=77519 RepID=A0A1Y1JQ88_PLAGO|nr:hypothetical protein PGO_141910 [Plasmodium gonderi]GAW83397.1 hypothetical protein PGO_141910 [Plasmodium gonderi]
MENISEMKSYEDKEREPICFGDISENYNFSPNNYTISDSFEKKEKKKKKVREHENNRIMESLDGRSDFFNDDKNSCSYSKGSDNISAEMNKQEAEKSASPLYENNEGCKTNKYNSNNIVGSSNSTIPLSSENLEENILKKLKDHSSYDDEHFGSDGESCKILKFCSKKSTQKGKSSEEINWRLHKSSLKSEDSNSKFENYDHVMDAKFYRDGNTNFSHISSYEMTEIGNTEKTGLWLVDTINEMLDKLCDKNDEDSCINSRANIHTNSNSKNLNNPELAKNRIFKWPEYLKFQNIIFYSHILPIYEEIRSVFIEYQRRILEQKNKNGREYSYVLRLPIFPHENVKDKCISETYSNLPDLNEINEGTAWEQYARSRYNINWRSSMSNRRSSTSNGRSNMTNGSSNMPYGRYHKKFALINDDDYDDNLFFNLPYVLQKVRDKYNNFCEYVGKELEHIDRENYTMKQYCFVVSKSFAKNIIRTIPFSKFPILLKHMFNSFHMCMRQENNEFMSETDFMNSNNLQHSSNNLNTMYTLPIDLDNSISNLNSTIRLNYIGHAKKNTCVNSNPLFTSNGENQFFSGGINTTTNEQRRRHSISLNFNGINRNNKNLLGNTLEDRRNYLTRSFNTLPKYVKTCANSRSKLSKSLRSNDLIKMSSMKNNSFINTDMLDRRRTSCTPETNKNEITRIDTTVDHDTTNNYLENTQINSLNGINESINVSESDNYYTAKSLPLN